MAKHSAHILELARRGAEHRFRELQDEIASLVRSFPYLRSSSTGRRRGRPAAGAFTESGATPGRRRRRRRSRMSAAARKAVS